MLFVLVLWLLPLCAVIIIIIDVSSIFIFIAICVLLCFGDSWMFRISIQRNHTRWNGVKKRDLFNFTMLYTVTSTALHWNRSKKKEVKDMWNDELCLFRIADLSGNYNQRLCICDVHQFINPFAVTLATSQCFSRCLFCASIENCMRSCVILDVGLHHNKKVTKSSLIYGCLS